MFTYVSVEPFHLFRYLDEQAFRFNERKDTDSERFAKVVPACVGKRLTYRQLTATMGETPPALSMEKEQDSQTDPTLTSRFFSKADPQRKKQTRFPAKRVVFPGEFPVQTPATSGAFS